jgi:hypothetical protein
LPTSSQNNGRLAGVVSAGLSMVVLLFLIASWPVKEQPGKLLERVHKPPKPWPVALPKPIAVSLPAPPKIQPPKVKVIQAKSIVKSGPSPIKLLRPKNTQSLIRKAVSKPPKNPVSKISGNATDLLNAVEKGRTLLRLLEHGTGPSVEFAWPNSAGARAALYQLLVQCHGMRVAVLDAENRLFTKESARGEKWQINLDRYSMFMRQISGRSEASEQLEISRIKQRQSGLVAAKPVRIFTRRMDAYVLGSLGQIIGVGYRSKSTIHAHYKVSDKTIFVTDIIADGVSKSGQIRVPCYGRRGD